MQRSSPNFQPQAVAHVTGSSDADGPINTLCWRRVLVLEMMPPISSGTAGGASSWCGDGGAEPADEPEHEEDEEETTGEDEMEARC